MKEDAEGNVGLDFLANLDRHSKPVNCVRFSPDGKIIRPISQFAQFIDNILSFLR